MRLVNTFLFTILLPLPLVAQTEPGDLAIIRYNTDSPDGFSFVVLREFNAGDSLFFTDEGWDATAGLTGWRESSEEHLLYTSPGLQAGDVVHIDEISPDSFSVRGAGGNITLRRGSSFSLFNGDQILVYSGNNGLRPASPEFIVALHGDDGSTTISGSNDPVSGWTKKGEVSGTTLSTLPDKLINGSTAISLFPLSGTEQDNAIYDCSLNIGSRSQLLVSINNASNWLTSNSAAYDTTSSCNSFTVSTDPSVIISGDAGWRILSLPKEDGTVADVSDDAPVQGINGGGDATADPNFYINTGSDGSSGNGYTVPASLSTAWGDGLGFIMYFFDNTTNGSAELPLALDVSGTEPTGDVTVSLSNTWTLLGNPYQSNIELDSLKGNDSGSGVNDGLASPVSVWDDTASTWRTFNFGSSNSQNLAVWQGFFLQRGSSSTTQVTIPAGAKSDSSADAAIFTKQLNPQFRQLSLHLRTDEGHSDKSTKLYFSAISGDSEDAYDGLKIGSLSGSPQISFVNDFGEGDRLYVQDARALNPDNIQRYRLYLNDAGVSGNYTISWPEMKNIPEDWEFVLMDKETGESVDMMLENSYTIVVQSLQKRAGQSILAQPALLAEKDGGTEVRFEIQLIPGEAVSNEQEQQPSTFTLEQNFPNPFNPSTTIRYTIERAGEVRLAVYNMLGQQVAELVNANQASGSYQVNWNAAGNASGVYFYRLESAGQSITRQMTLIK